MLPGGGVNGAFQAGFIYKLMLDYREYYDFVRVDGISVGALNGICCLLENPEMIRSIWYNIEHRDYIFNSHDSYYNMWNNGSIFNSDGLRKIVYEYSNFIDRNLLERFNCVVHKYSNGSYEYINGNESDILDFVISSASPPIISKSSKIGDDWYSDGCIDQVYPVNFVNDNNDINLLLGYYDQNNYYLFNIYKYLKPCVQENVDNTDRLIDSGYIYPVVNPCQYSLIDFNRENIDFGFTQGMKKCDIFAKEMLFETEPIKN